MSINMKRFDQWLFMCFCILNLTLSVRSCIRSQQAQQKTLLAEDKWWTFTANGNRRPQNYLDKNGVLVGFEIDLANAVCKQANKNCQWIKYDYKECSTSDENDHFLPGRGLREGWFDACGGRIITEERLNFVRFSKPYTEKSYARFLVKTGNPKNFSTDHIEGRTLVYLAGTYTNQVCLDAIGFKGAQLIAASGINEAVELVQTEQVDALFGPRTKINGFDRLPGDYDCSLGGNAFMTLPDNFMIGWWDPAFQELRESGEFEELCKESQKKHGGRIKCSI